MKVDQYYFSSLNIKNSINTLKTIKIEILHFKQIKIAIPMEEALQTQTSHYLHIK